MFVLDVQVVPFLQVTDSSKTKGVTKASWISLAVFSLLSRDQHSITTQYYIMNLNITGLSEGGRRGGEREKEGACVCPQWQGLNCYLWTCT